MLAYCGCCRHAWKGKRALSLAACEQARGTLASAKSACLPRGISGPARRAQGLRPTRALMRKLLPQGGQARIRSAPLLALARAEVRPSVARPSLSPFTRGKQGESGP